mgnify:CR=1 FL=1
MSNPIITIEMENGGIIRAELYPEIAPITVENFVKLTKKGFYDGIIFHRVIPGFMIQGGCPDGTGMGGPGYCIKGEFFFNGVKNELKHKRGVLSMARSQSPNSAGSQFFIMHADNDYLDGDYAAFGMVLGGIDENGNDCFSELTKLCLIASRNLKMIDPKINLRVSKNTPLSIYEKGTELTRAGLGFPQYSNDDTVIPALVNLGYDPADAADYTVAACWEFIVPKCGADVANIGALSFPKVVDNCLHNDLAKSNSFDEFLAFLNAEISRTTSAMCDNIKDLWFVPSPFANVFMLFPMLIILFIFYLIFVQFYCKNH